MNKPIIINIYTIIYSYLSLTFLKLPWLIESFKSSSTTRKGNLIELLTYSHSVMAAYIYIHIYCSRPFSCGCCCRCCCCPCPFCCCCVELIYSRFFDQLEQKLKPEASAARNEWINHHQWVPRVWGGKGGVARQGGSKVGGAVGC